MKKIDEIILNKIERTCKCGKKIFAEEPCGLTSNYETVCMFCAKASLREEMVNNNFLSKELNKLYKLNLKKIMANRL